MQGVETIEQPGYAVSPAQVRRESREARRRHRYADDTCFIHRKYRRWDSLSPASATRRIRILWRHGQTAVLLDESGEIEIKKKGPALLTESGARDQDHLDDVSHP